MSASVAKLPSRWLWVCRVVLVAVALMVGAPGLQHKLARGWGQYHEPAPAGPEEAHVQQLLLSDRPLEDRFTGLYQYFAAGFLGHAVPGYARVQFGGAGSRNGYAMDGLEGFARTAPLLAVWGYSGRERATRGATLGRSTSVIETLRSGLLSGVNRSSGNYWGEIREDDQRIVEAADIARVVWLTRTSLWDKLPREDQERVHAWLLMAGAAHTPRTNWMLFPVVIDLVLAGLRGDAEGRELKQRAHTVFSEYKHLYRDRGWFYDPPYGIDFYNTWSISYDLFWIHRIDPTFESDFIVRAIENSANLTQYLISPQGVAIMGRSVCYRTAVPVPLIAATLLESSRFPHGRGARALDVVWRYFVAHGSLRDGALTQGYFKADLRLLDRYSGSGSCQWGLRSLILAFMHPPGDDFWQAPEEALPVESADYRLELANLGWIIEGQHGSGEITITIPGNPTDVGTLEEYSWVEKLEEVLLREPARPSNHEIKYESRHYSSASPYPLKN